MHAKGANDYTCQRGELAEHVAKNYAVYRSAPTIVAQVVAPKKMYEKT